jgi:Bacterial Ig-like domain (group 3)
VAARAALYGSLLQTAPHYPFYDVTSGCNSNDITLAYGLGFYCAQSGYDLATGWGSANMLQLAWGLNWAVAATGAAPTVTFGGPATNVWYNKDQVIDWSVNDVATAGFNPTGIAGFTQGWDWIPTDSRREATPGSGDSFYAGPQHINASFGCTDLSGALCSGGVSQGCHTMHVRGWNNMGVSSGDNTYGPVCYDTVAPATTLTLSGTKTGAVYSTPVKSTLSAADASSGVASTLYSVDGGAAVKYTGPFAVSAVGAHTVSYHSIDVAGNVEPSHSAAFKIESPTATKLASSLNPAVHGQSVTFTATVSPSFGAVATGTVTLKVGTSTLGTGTLSGGKATFTTKTLPAGADAITAVYGGSASDLTSTSAALTQTVKKATTTTALTSSLNPATHGKSVTFTATIKPQYAGTVTGTVTFKDGTKTLGTGAVNGLTDKATYTTSTLAVGTHAITAAFGGNSNNVASTSSSLSEVIK